MPGVAAAAPTPRIGSTSDVRDEADRRARAIARDVAARDGAARATTAARCRPRASDLLARRGVARIVVVRRAARALVDVGDAAATFPATPHAGRRRPPAVGTSGLGRRRPTQYAGLVKRHDRPRGRASCARAATSSPARSRRRTPAAAARAQGTSRPTSTASSYRDVDVHAARLPRRARSQIARARRAATADPRPHTRKLRCRPAAVLVGFFILAFTFAVLVSRSLQRQIDAFLVAARRLGGGDFSDRGADRRARRVRAARRASSTRCPASSSERVEELRQERARLQQAMRRIGETFASNLDRDGAAGDRRRDRGRRRRRRGRAARRCGRRGSEPLEQVALAGDVEGLEEAIRAAEAQVLETGEP